MQNSGEASLHTLQHQKHKRQFYINQVWAGKQADRQSLKYLDKNQSTGNQLSAHSRQTQAAIKIHHLKNRIKTKTPKATSKPLITVHSLTIIIKA